MDCWSITIIYLYIYIIMYNLNLVSIHNTAFMYLMLKVVKAFVVLKDDHKHRDHDELMEELQNHVRNSTAPYKYPRKVI